MKLLDQKAYRNMYEKNKELYTFGFCELGEIDKVIGFLEENWKKNYSLCLSRELMDWQFRDDRRGVYNFLIAKHKESSEIHGLIGVIPSNGDFKEGKPTHFYLSIASTIQSLRSSLAIFLYCYMEEHFDIKSSTSTSLGELGTQVFRKLGFNGGMMDHYYVVNKNFKEFKILDKFDGIYCFDSEDDSEKSLEIIDKSIFINFIRTINMDDCVIEKTMEYYTKRYTKHPVYSYKFAAVKTKDKIKAVFIYRLLREQNYCIKLIDLVGDEKEIRGIGLQWQKFLNHYNAEYADIYCVGLSEELMNQSGFLKRNSSNGVVVPHYFEPFVRSNIDIRYGTKTDIQKKLLLFRGDGDQDRPQIINR